MTQYELEEILKLHKMWLNGEKGGKRANLTDANLTDANLTGAILRRANLSDANLIGTILIRADLRYCVGNNQEVKSLQTGTYLISYTKDILNIGYESHTLDEWKVFTDDEISKMDEYALEWWKLNKEIIISLVEKEIKG